MQRTGRNIGAAKATGNAPDDLHESVRPPEIVDYHRESFEGTPQEVSLEEVAETARQTKKGNKTYPAGSVKVWYECCGKPSFQYLTSIVESGTAACSVCDGEMPITHIEMI